MKTESLVKVADFLNMSSLNVAKASNELKLDIKLEKAAEANDYFTIHQLGYYLREELAS